MSNRGDNMIFKNIEAERARNGYSKEKLSASIGVSVKTYYNWLNGTNPIPSTALMKMADIFNVEVDYLLGRKGRSYGAEAFPSRSEKEMV